MRWLTPSLILLIAGAACSDPVTDGNINALGGELPNVPVGEYHRAGQPCVDCHSPSGPASGSPFSVAGTVFAQPSNPTGVDQATIAELVDKASRASSMKANPVELTRDELAAIVEEALEPDGGCVAADDGR